MSRLGFKSVRIYHGETFLGELEAVPVKDSKDFQFPNNEIRISHISQPFERSPPLSVLQTISSFSVRCKLVSHLPSKVSNLPPNDPLSHLLGLHASCFHQHKTAVVVFGAEEIHLVAMPSKEKKFPCFWCCSVRVGLYNSCLSMLNLRCLAIVFDLDETLIVANSLKSFEDRIEALKVWISREMDPIRLSGMAAELKRYSDDRALLKQFADHDCVTDCGILYKAQFEDVPQLSENHEKFARPVIRLPEKNVVLTRINPENRDTSVLVRLRPAWEDLRSYLTAKGRKRFEVFVCTMAERDYAFEIWRLLDPEHHLINIKQLLNRVVCVKPGSKKSLLNVFHDGVCHPNLAMVIDDRLKVWEDKDQPRVHVVPAFSPYYAPQAETAHPVPVLCVARNVACNVRGGFFKEFDESLHKRIIELSVEDDTSNLPPPPDVSNFLLVEDAGFALPNGSAIPMPEGMSGAEVEQRLYPRDERLATDSASSMQATVPELRPEIAAPLTASASNITNPPFPCTTIAAAKPSLLGVPVKKDGLISELNIDKKRKLSMTKHGIDGQNPISADPPLLRFPSQIPAVPAQCSGGWLAEDDTSRGKSHTQPFRVVQESNVLKADKHRALHNTPNYSTTPGQLSDLTRGRVQEVGKSHESQKPTFLSPNQAQGLGNSEATFSQSQASSVNKEYYTDALKSNTICSSLSINVLHEIGRRCNSRVEFRSVVSTRNDLQFSIEVLLTGETIGVGMGKTRKDAQQQAAENALQSLADGYAEFIRPTSETANRDYGKVSPKKENGFIWDDADSRSAVERCGGESTSERTEMPIGSSSIVSQQLHDSNLHRFQKSGSSKWLKDDVQSGSQGISSRQQKNGNRPIL